eukprot:scaffold114673_cov51-Phaeocystis_antarctica.AAC.1
MGRELLPRSGPCRRQRGGAGWAPPAGLSPRWVPPMQRERKRVGPGGRKRGGGRHRKEALEGDGPTVGAAKGSGAVGGTPLSDAPDLVTSCSATDWPVELDGGPGGSDAAGALRRDVNRLVGSPSWHGLARSGSWHGPARSDDSTARTTRQQRQEAR